MVNYGEKLQLWRFMKSNPFSLTFGKHPEKYISRYENTDMILSTFSSENPLSHTYLIEGVRGSGKTVLMTTISQQLSAGKEWIIVDLNSTRGLMDDLAHRLYDSCSNIPKLLDKGFNVSIAGVGIGIGGSAGFQDSISIITKLLSAAKKKNKKILITIDEVMHSKDMREFASQFQIWLRQDFDIFLIMTGLYKNMNAIQNDPALTFLLRSPRIILKPLSIRQITSQYEEIFEIDEPSAMELAEITKGYALAFQALGTLYWEFGKETPLDSILKKLDDLLEDFAYKKIWESLSDVERDIIGCINTDKTKVLTIRNQLSMASGTFSKYRDNLVKSGILMPESHGYVSLALPRFYEVTRFF